MNKLIISIALSLMLFHPFSSAASHHKMVFVQQYDLDGNWQLFKGEFNEARLLRFDKTDENKDKFVSEDEYVFEYQNKLDKQLEDDRKSQIRQTKVRFKALDKNQNERLEWDEYKASGERNFSRYDSNNDNRINEQDPEYKSTWKNKQKEVLTEAEKEQKRESQLRFAQRILKMPTTHDKEGMLAKYDSNQDGTVTLQEHNQQRQATYNLTDENADGWISEDEYLFEYQNRLDTQIAKTRTAAIKQTHVRFKVLDINEDGKMTIAEYQASGHRSFARWDTNQDDIVSMEEAMPEPRQRGDETNKNNLTVASARD
ncbi:hypothetical protein [Aliiglaciecola sp. NS0011-25]|uniref:hypothetical protein n=1 Tax=Aliiglaciecola sp. NS0011-25 TaxID=3127654 RepID=UPI003103B9BF